MSYSTFINKSLFYLSIYFIYTIFKLTHLKTINPIILLNLSPNDPSILYGIFANNCYVIAFSINHANLHENMISNYLNHSVLTPFLFLMVITNLFTQILPFSLNFSILQKQASDVIA